MTQIAPQLLGEILMKKISQCISITAVVLLFAGAASAQMTREDMELVDEGFEVFNEETFGGNGRTCGTCHIPSESYNIFPSTIKQLGKKDRKLVFATNVPGLENFDLIKTHALFNTSGGANVCPASDPTCFHTPGEEHSGPIFRSTMGIFAIEITSVNTRPFFPGTPLLPANCSAGGLKAQLDQLGWAGDGAPGSLHLTDNACRTHHGILDMNANGTLRAFANGAIAQHATKSLERNLGTDFRFATDAELDAMEALQLWLGRRALTDEENAIQGTAGATEFDLTLLDFSDARVALGRDHFVGGPELAPSGGPGGPPGPPVLDPNSGAGCNGCHLNAGANATIGPGGFPANINVNTDVEHASDDIGLRVVGVPLPPDEGGASSFPPPNRPPAFEEAFNVQSIIESAQKKGWFHNHRATESFEGALEFYFSDDFIDNGPGFFTTEAAMRNGNQSGSISFPKGDGVEHLGAFLRTLNAFYNLRDCERLLDEAIDRINNGVEPMTPVLHCQFNLGHALDSLKYAKLRRVHRNVQRGAKKIHRKLYGARYTRNTRRIERLRDSIRSLRDSIAVQVSPAP